MERKHKYWLTTNIYQKQTMKQPFHHRQASPLAGVFGFSVLQPKINETDYGLIYKIRISQV